jgi:transposase
MRQIESLLSEKQWLKIEPLLPKPKPSVKGGRPPADNRAVVEGILWVLKTGARWRDLPPQYPSPSTCWRRLRDWEEQDVWLKVWHSFIAELDEANHLEWEETFADGSFAPAKKGALESAKPRKAKEPSGWWWSMAREFLWHPRWRAHRQRR